MTGVIIRKRRGRLDTVTEDTHRGKKFCDDRIRLWSDPVTSQGMPKTTNNHQKLGDRHGTDSTSEAPEGTNLANILILDFWLPEL